MSRRRPIVAAAFLVLWPISTAIVFAAALGGADMRTALGLAGVVVGYADVSIALTLALLWIALRASEPSPRAFVLARPFVELPGALALVAGWLLRESADLNILLPGLAWRVFVLAAAAPHILGALTARPHNQTS